MALYIEYQINKNALLQTVFPAIFPTGLDLWISSHWSTVIINYRYTLNKCPWRNKRVRLLFWIQIILLCCSSVSYYL